jgi:hypothetical protein
MNMPSLYPLSNRQSNVYFGGRGMQTMNQTIRLSNETVQGSLQSMSGDIHLQNVQVLGGASTMSGDITLKDSSSVQAGVSSMSGSINIKNAKVSGDVTTKSGDVSLLNTQVQGDVSTLSGSVSLKNADITGTLSFPANRFTLEGSKVGNIRLFPLNSAGSVVISGGSIFTSGSIVGGNVVIGGSGGGSVIGVGPGSRSNVNGYDVTATATETKLVTPEGTTYVNGDRVKGEGAATYAEYKQTKRNAPTIQGPGWRNEGVQGQSATPESRVPTEPDQILELKPGAEVKGEIVFVGENGKVIVHPGAVFDGNVQGGILERKN